MAPPWSASAPRSSARAADSTDTGDIHAEPASRRRSDRRPAQGARRNDRHRRILDRRADFRGAARRAGGERLFPRRQRDLHPLRPCRLPRDPRSAAGRDARLHRTLCRAAGRHGARPVRRELGPGRDRRHRPHRQPLRRRRRPYLHRARGSRDPRAHAGNRQPGPRGEHARFRREGAGAAGRGAGVVDSAVVPLAPELSVVVPCYNERANVAPMVARLDAALSGIAWEAIFVDDNSPDGTAEAAREIARRDPRIRAIRRVGRRGLASAVIEGALASSADYVAVIDGDLQHDETRLPDMLAALRGGGVDVAVGSRHVAGGDATGLANAWRHRLSEAGIRLAQYSLPEKLTDPMSGFFMLPRPLFEHLAPRLTGQGFKILLDLLLSAPEPLRVREIAVRFHAREAGESKLDVLVLLQFAGLLADKMLGGVLPLRFISFALVGLLGVGVNLALLFLGRAVGMGFAAAETAATIIAMVFNFALNNAVTYRDQRLRGPRLWRGLVLFLAVCGVGAVANIGIARSLFAENLGWTVAGLAGAAIGVVWNYAVSATLVWRAR
ncbi:MAG: glycosyltransferase [Rhodospirillales bacterium]|nr:glycosyltransferase [Rhodospirillales bacterium]